MLAIHGLNIDEHTIGGLNTNGSFLDIQYCFDNNGHIQTDLCPKEADIRSCLEFDSSLPRHNICGIIY